MKKIIIIILCCLICTSSYNKKIHAQSKNIQVLIEIENAQELYLLSIKGEQMKVQIISNKMYLPISCMSNEAATLKSVDFKNSYECLLNSINQSLHLDIKYYAHIKMKKLLNRLDIKKNTYDYKTLDSLCDTGKLIKDKISIPVVLDYQKYIDTNINFEILYDFYNFFKKEKIEIKYYTLSYFVSNHKYLPMSTTFHLRK